MEKKDYKLVLDRIPEIVVKNGQSCVTRALEPEEYLQLVDAKLDEELAEYHREQKLDLMEVIVAAAEARGYTREQLEQLRRQKIVAGKL